MLKQTLTSVAVIALLSSGGIALAQSKLPDNGAVGQPKTMEHSPGTSKSTEMPGKAGSSQMNSTAKTPAAPNEAASSVDLSKVEHGTAFSKIIGNSVYNAKGDSIGSLEDIVLVPSDNKLYGVLSVGGFLGIGNHLVAVPYDSLHFGTDNKIVMANATKDSLKAAPEFKYPSESKATTPSRSSIPSRKP